MYGFIERHAHVVPWLVLTLAVSLLLILTGALNFFPDRGEHQFNILAEKALRLFKEHSTSLHVAYSSLFALATLIGATWAVVKGIRYARGRLPVHFAKTMSGDYDSRTVNRDRVRELVDHARRDLQFNRVTLHVAPLHLALKQLGHGYRDDALRNFAKAQDVAAEQETVARERLDDLRDQRTTAHVLSGVIRLQMAREQKLQSPLWRENMDKAYREFEAARKLDPNDLDALELAAATVGQLRSRTDEEQHCALILDRSHALLTGNAAGRKRYDADLIAARTNRRLGDIYQERGHATGVNVRFDNAREYYETGLQLLSGSSEDMKRIECARLAVGVAEVARQKNLRGVLAESKRRALQFLDKLTGDEVMALRAKINAL